MLPIAGLGRDQASKPVVQFLLSAYHSFTTIKSKTLELKHSWIRDILTWVLSCLDCNMKSLHSIALMFSLPIHWEPRGLLTDLQMVRRFVPMFRLHSVTYFTISRTLYAGASFILALLKKLFLRNFGSIEKFITFFFFFTFTMQGLYRLFTSGFTLTSFAC